nr:hypothetical protein [Tanacetum cinerariifolium]
KLHHNSIRFKIDTRKSVLDLEAFRDMLHISPRIPNQPFADLTTEEEILDFLRFLGHSHDIRYLTDVKELVLNQGFRMYHLMIRRKNFRGNLWTMKTLVVMKKAKNLMKVMMIVMKEVIVILKSGASKDDDDDDDEDDDDNDDEEELAKDDEEDKETGKGGDEVRESEGESDEEQEEEESFDPIPRTPDESEEESNDEEEQESRLSEEARIQEEEDADELYRDVNINQGKGLQVTQNVKDTHVTLTPVNPDGPQESSSMSSFVSRGSPEKHDKNGQLSK